MEMKKIEAVGTQLQHRSTWEEKAALSIALQKKHCSEVAQ